MRKLQTGSIVLMFATATLVGCSASRKQPISYLNNIDSTSLPPLQLEERIIQKADLVSINVYSDNPAATAIFNQPILNTPSRPNENVPASSSTSGYLVDDQGNIQFQGIGSLKAEGLTKQQLADSLIQRLKVYLSNPYCSIRLLNYKVTVMGEVAKPNTYNISNERINVLEAIGMAGDVTLYGRKDNVMIVREVSGKREVGRLDLRNKEIFKSPFYYLQQNDMVIVDQFKNKQQATDQVTLRNISILATIISTLAIVFSAVRR